MKATPVRIARHGITPITIPLLLLTRSRINPPFIPETLQPQRRPALGPHGGRPLRKSVPMPPKGVRISSINHMGDGIVPWNYEWDGKCENCGHDYNVVMQINMGSTGPDNKIRETEIKVGANGFMHDITANLGEGSATVLSGVEITTKCGHDHSEELFLSANELKHLMKVLQNSPILKQFDYYVEDNEKNKYRT